MITINGREKLAKILSAEGGQFCYLAYGSGTTAESESHTALVSETGRLAAFYQITSTYSAKDTIAFFAEGVAASAGTINEVGLFDSASGGVMLQRKKLDTGVVYSAVSPIFLYMRSVIKPGYHVEAS